MSLSLGLTLSYWPGTRADISRWDELVRRAEDIGFDAIGVADTSFLFGDASGRLTLAGLASRSAQVGLHPTNPVTREPQIMAAMLGTVDAVTDGRAFLTMGSGDSAVYNVGLRPGSRRRITEYVACVRGLLRDGEGTFLGRTQRIRWTEAAVRDSVPIGILAEGPKMLHLAGEIGDFAVIASGFTPELLRDSIARVEAGARSAGRDPADVKVWAGPRCALDPDREVARERVKASLSSILNHAMRFGLDDKMVPLELRDLIQEYVDGYILQEHIAQANADRMDAFGLTDYAFDRWALAGDPATWVERIQQIAAAGVQGIWVTLGPDLGRQGDALDLFAKEVLPNLR